MDAKRGFTVPILYNLKVPDDRAWQPDHMTTSHNVTAQEHNDVSQVVASHEVLYIATGAQDIITFKLGQALDRTNNYSAKKPYHTLQKVDV